MSNQERDSESENANANDMMAKNVPNTPRLPKDPMKRTGTEANTDAIAIAETQTTLKRWGTIMTTTKQLRTSGLPQLHIPVYPSSLSKQNETRGEEKYKEKASRWWKRILTRAEILP